MTATTQLPTKTKPRSLVEKFAGKYSLDPGKMMGTLKATAFRQKGQRAQEITNEQMAALIVVADQYNLNPFTKEIYAYPDNGAIVPVVGVDGWARIINEHSQADGIEFRESDEVVTHERNEHKPCPAWIECVLYRRDRKHPTIVREYFDEVYRAPFKEGMRGPWQTHTKRMMRHKVLIQAARLGFGFTGIHDADEAERIIDASAIDGEVVPNPATNVPEGGSTTDKIKAKLGIADGEREAEVDTETGEIIDAEATEEKTEEAGE